MTFVFINADTADIPVAFFLLVWQGATFHPIFPEHQHRQWFVT